VPLDQRQGLDDGPVPLVGGAEVQHLQQFHQPGAVVVAAGGLEHLPPGAGEGGVGRLHLGDQVRERLLPAGRRVDHLAHAGLGGAERGGGDLPEQPGLAADLGELGDERLGHLLLRPRVDAVHGGVRQLHQRVGDLPLPLEQQGGEQDVPHLGGEASQVAGRGRRRSGPPGAHDLDADPGERLLRDADGADLLELGDLLQQRVEADVARMGLDVREHRLHVVFVVLRGRLILGGAVAGQVGEDQRVQAAGAALGPRQAGGDLGDGALVGLVQRGADDRVDLGRGRRLDQLRAHLPQQLGPHLLLASFVVPDHVHQVRDELDQVGPGALVPAGQIPQLAAVPFPGTGGEVVEPQLGRGNAHLLGDVLDSVGRQLQAHPGKPAAPGQELELNGEAQPGGAGLVPFPSPPVISLRAGR
jgi:hypothetical protein